MCSGDYGIGFWGLSHNMGAYLVQGHLGQNWLCFLCKADVQYDRDCTAGSGAGLGSTGGIGKSAAASGGHACAEGARIIMWPTDAFRRRVYLQPWGLYLISEGGTFESLHIDASAGLIKITFEPSAGRLASRNQLRVEQPSELESHQSIHVCATPARTEPHREGSSSGYKGGEICVLKTHVTSHAADGSQSSRSAVFSAGEYLQGGEGSCVRHAQCSICREDGRTLRLRSTVGRDASSSCTSLMLALRKAGDAEATPV